MVRDQFRRFAEEKVIPFAHGWHERDELIPMAVMGGLILMLMAIVQMRFKPTRREMIIALFTGFVASYFVMTIIGTFFRGYAMELQLYWPWTNLHAGHH